MDVRELLEALIAFERDARQSACEVVRTGWGAVIRNGRYPRIHLANHAWVDAVPPGGIEEILEGMDDVLGATAVRHRSLIFADADEAFEAQEEFARRGFSPTADLAMARVGLPSCIVNKSVDVREVDDGTTADHYRRLVLEIEDSVGNPEDVSQALYELDRERAALLGWRSFVAYLNDEPAGIFTVWPRNGFALIENVGTHRKFRMQGVGRTMIFRACNIAIDSGSEYALLWTNYFDTPQAMYKTLGFEPVGELRGFLRDPI